MAPVTRALVLATLAAALLAPPAQAAVSRGGISEHLRALQAIADQHGGTRAATTPGDAASVRYVASELREDGYTVRLQTFSFAYFEERRPPVLGDLRPGRDFVTTRQSASGTGEGRVRRIRAGGCRTRDFGALRRGELALIRSVFCPPEGVAARARRAGASALLVEERSAPRAFFVRPTVRLPILQVARRPAERLVAAGTPVRVAVDALRERRRARNVLAERGTGRRVVMAGGHLDSVPEGPGINDNASGVAAVLEMAEQLAASPPRGARLRLGLWGAEEWGLRGSRAYVRSLSRTERRRIAGYVNLDMVGSPNGAILVYGSRRMREALHRQIGVAATIAVGGSSDHAPFRAAGIPVGGIYTGGPEIKRRSEARAFGGKAGEAMDPCYHRACDVAAGVDTRLAARAANATLRVLRGLGRSTRRAAR